MIMMNILAAMLLIPVLAVSGGVQMQMDMDYTGAVDQNTGAPLESDTDDPEVGAAYVNLPDGGIYNRQEHTFVYSAPGSSFTIRSSVAGDMITTEAVSIKVDEGLNTALYLNSREVTDANLDNITAPGSYTVVAKGSENDQQLMAFTIVSKITGDIDRYKLPSGFTVSSIVYEGEEADVSDKHEVDLSGEGRYQIRYRCIPTGIEYMLDVEMDHTAPEFTLSGVENGMARGPVTLEGVEKDDTVAVTFNGEEANLPLGGVFKNVGRYKITVTDKAGNNREESFTIRMYLNYQSIIFFILAVGIIAGTVTFMVLTRNNMRIR